MIFSFFYHLFVSIYNINSNHDNVSPLIIYCSLEIQMKKSLLLMAMMSTSVFAGTIDMKIVGALDGPLAGGLPKMIEVYVINDIPDLTLFGIGSANNGGGTDGQEFTFPAGSATAGTFLYLASEAPMFTTYFGFAPDYTDGAASINGDDAIELFQNGNVVDIYGDINVDGTGTAWDHLDSFAHRNNGTGPDGSTFVLGNWTVTAPNTLDSCSTTNDACEGEGGATYPLALVPVELMNFSVE